MEQLRIHHGEIEQLLYFVQFLAIKHLQFIICSSLMKPIHTSKYQCHLNHRRLYYAKFKIHITLYVTKVISILTTADSIMHNSKFQKKALHVRFYTISTAYVHQNGRHHEQSLWYQALSKQSDCAS